MPDPAGFAKRVTDNPFSGKGALLDAAVTFGPDADPRPEAGRNVRRSLSYDHPPCASTGIALHWG